MLHLRFCALLFTLSFAGAPAVFAKEAPAPLAQSPVPHAAAETPEQYAARMQWWRDARFGMFIHWDMSSVAGTEISWSRKGSKPLDITGNGPGYVADPVYDNLCRKFNPVKFDAKAWVRTAQAAGMKYIVLTAKHHGGFCMWDTKLTDYSIMHTPFKRDVVGELADACHEAGMKFGIYYSQRDWHHPDYGMGDNRKYVDYMNGQVRELLTHYGKVDVIWWDSYGRGDLEKFWRIGETFDMVRSLQPAIVMNNRMAVLGQYDRQPRPYLGDFRTPEQKIGGFETDRNWESCMCVVKAPRGGWSYRTDGHVKSFDECMRTLVGCATGDGNLLLDVGPNAQGEIPADQVARITQMGQWLKANGESIYGTRGGPWKPAAWGGSTHHGKTAYIHLFERPKGDLALPAIPGRKVIQARLLAGGEAVAVKEEDGRIALSIPGSGAIQGDLVVALTMSDTLDGLPPLAADAKGCSFALDPAAYGKVVAGGAQAAKDGVLDLGKEMKVTGLFLGPMSGAAVRVRASRDGKRWAVVPVSAEAQKTGEIPIGSVAAGADVPGRPVRFLKFDAPDGKPVPALWKHAEVYAKE